MSFWLANDSCPMPQLVRPWHASSMEAETTQKALEVSFHSMATGMVDSFHLYAVASTSECC